MSEFRTVEGELKILERTGDFIFPVELWMLNDSVNRNNWKFINLEEHRTQWAGVPILVAYVNGGRTVGAGHNQRTKVDGEGNEYQSFTDATAERICGALSDDPNDIRLESRDGYTWVVGRGFLWAWYCRELVEKIADDAEQGRSMSVSIEALVTQSRTEDGYEVEEQYVPLGVTILGDRVQPAVPDAHIAMLNAMKDEFKELKLRAASYIDHPESATDQKPQEKSMKGLKKDMRLSNQQLRELQPKFGEKKVLAAEQRENGAVDVCLMGNGGTTYLCRLSSIDETVDFEKFPERIARVNVKAHFCAEDGDDICVDASDMTECATENAEASAKELESCKAELETCKAELATMKANEDARRLAAAKKAATDTLEAFNRNRENKVDTKVLEALNKDIDAGKFTACEDENHAWNGDKTIEMQVKALCADAVMEFDEKLAAKKAEGQPLMWGNIKKAAAAPGTIGELFASKNNQNK